MKSRLVRKTLTLGRIEGRRRRGWQGMRWWDTITNSVDLLRCTVASAVSDSV